MPHHKVEENKVEIEFIDTIINIYSATQLLDHNSHGRTLVARQRAEKTSMGTKRYHEEVDSDVEASDASSEPSSKRTKHQDKEGTLGRSKSKKRVRTIKKQLQNDDNIPADVRMELERELAVHETAIAETAFQKKRAAMIAKYHMVRFFGECRKT